MEYLLIVADFVPFYFPCSDFTATQKNYNFEQKCCKWVFFPLLLHIYRNNEAIRPKKTKPKTVVPESCGDNIRFDTGLQGVKGDTAQHLQEHKRSKLKILKSNTTNSEHI